MNRTAIANNWMIFQVLTEMQITTYQNCSALRRFYKPSLQTKLKNLQVEFEREAKTFHQMFQENEDEYLKYLQCVTLFEKILESAGDLEKFNSAVQVLTLLYNGEFRFAKEEDLVNEK
jgi:hypothetical protein